MRPREAEALQASAVARLAEHRHRESIVRVESSPRRCIVSTAPPVVATLERFLRVERGIGLGAAVTLLAPVVGAVRSAALEGAWLAPTTDDIGLTEEGRPLLLLTTPAVDTPRAARDALQRVLERLGMLCPELPVAALARHRDLLALEGNLYGLADPQGIGEAVRALPTSGADARGREAVPAPAARHRRVHPLDGWQDRLRAFVVRRRGPLSVGTAIVLGAVLAGSLAGGPDRQVQDAEASTAAAPVPARSAPPAVATAAPPAPVAATSLDAEQAAEVLIDAVRACGDRECARGLVTADSPLGDAADGPASAVPATGEASAVLVDVNGASAVVHLRTAPGTTAASVLIIRTEAGWLIRDVYTGAAS